MTEHGRTRSAAIGQDLSDIPPAAFFEYQVKLEFVGFARVGHEAGKQKEGKDGNGPDPSADAENQGSQQESSDGTTGGKETGSIGE
jgi:hypothetical protein